MDMTILKVIRLGSILPFTILATEFIRLEFDWISSEFLPREVSCLALTVKMSTPVVSLFGGKIIRHS